MSLIVNRTDLKFLMEEIAGIEHILEADHFASLDMPSIDAILDTAEKIALDTYLPSAAEIDADEPQYVDGRAITHPKVKPTLQAYADAGFFATSFDEKDGGLQAPVTVQTAINGMFYCANLSVHNYSVLTVGAAGIIAEVGSEAQKAIFLSPMLEGRWLGTMCLSEPQAGSSLSDVKTKATLITGDRYAIEGTKMWISGGDQDFTENIVQMVLARIPGSPPGVKGLSLFIVPKFKVQDDGTIGADNNIALAGLNHKLGQRGTTNTILNFGEKGVCEGWLIGEPDDGLKNMFLMMNEARLAIGHSAVMLGLAGYLYSLDYARERTQGRHPGNKDPQTPQVPIIEHADIRRLLLSQKANVEGAQALTIYCASLVDRKKIEKDDSERARLDHLLDLLTPIVKSWPSEFCLEANKHAIQVLGGYGYTKDYPVERFYRDNRLNPIHEGAHSIHGIDILGRKVRMHGGAAFEAVCSEIAQTIAEARSFDSLGDEADALGDAVRRLSDAVAAITSAGDPARELSHATPFLDAFGHIVIAWMWLKQGVAITRRGEGAEPSDFASGKLRAMQYFYRYELPKIEAVLRLAGDMDETFYAMRSEEFDGVG